MSHRIGQYFRPAVPARVLSFLAIVFVVLAGLMAGAQQGQPKTAPEKNFASSAAVSAGEGVLLAGGGRCGAAHRSQKQ